MSLSAGSRTHSPLSSGRSSPQPRRRFDEDPTKKDPKYKRFSTSIDRALALFEGNNLQEWADYISFLGRLLKALQSHPSLPLIPSKSIVAQRLAQCLNPRLPSGVHQKTIEVYSYIFSLIGADGLGADLPLWTPGLTPVLAYASLTLKPHYLSLLERFYVPLGTSLRPALKALVLALLPGIDEEGGEYFDRTLALIEGIQRGVADDAYFWQCVLLATITSAARRQGALAFLARKLPRLPGAEEREPEGADEEGRTAAERLGETEALISPEPGLLVRALCAGLLDEQLLVQRGFLDLLVTNVPLSSAVLQQRVSRPDLQLLVISAAGVVMRRDMGLNRRLWAWFLGPDEAKAKEYFEAYGLDALVGGLMGMLDHRPNATSAERARPYRICLSLMDRWEVGSMVAPRLFFAAIESIRAYEDAAESKELYAEVFRSASMFFDGVEAGLIWGQILERINVVFAHDDDVDCGRRIKQLQSVRFIIRTFNVREDEMTMIHAPIIVLALLLHLSSASNDTADAELRREAFLLAEDIWDLVPDAAFRRQSTTGALPAAPAEDTDAAKFDLIQQFYSRDQRPSSTTSPDVPPFLLTRVAAWLFTEMAASVQRALAGSARDIGIQCALFVRIVAKVPRQPLLPSPLIAAFSATLAASPVPFVALQGIATVVAALQRKAYLEERDTGALVAAIVAALWHYLSPDAPKFHVEAVKVLWGLQDVLGTDRRIEAAVATMMTSTADAEAGSAEPGRKFAVLWMHSVGGLGGERYHLVLTRPLFLFLDALDDDGVEMSVFAQGWLQNLGSTNRLFWILATKLLDCEFLQNPGKRNADGAPLVRPMYGDDDFLEIGTYYFHTLLNVLRYSTNNVMAVLASELVVASDDTRSNALAQRGYGDDDMTLQTFFAHTALRAIDGDAADAKTSRRVSKLHKMALGVLHQLLLSPYASALASLDLDSRLTARLIATLDTPAATYVQVALLDVLHAALKLSLTRPVARSSTSTDDPRPQPPALLRALLGGFSHPSARAVLDSWIFFLGEALPLLSDVVFTLLLPLVTCLCTQIQATFDALQAEFREPSLSPAEGFGGRSPESTLVALLNGLEQILAVAHARLLHEEAQARAGAKSPDAPATAGGFFGSMVSGVFAVESPHARSSAANNRLTVLLCFQDTVKICYRIWSWGDAGSGSAPAVDAASRDSWAYTSLRMRGRARRILEHMFAAETLECLETLATLWPGAGSGDSAVFRLINVLDGSRPKHTVPAIFNAIYSRTNPSALDPARRSTLTAALTDTDVAVFLVAYARCLEDDAMDEIWGDCVVFLRDVLANPFPHRQCLPCLLAFTATLGEKVDNTNFGEQRRMRKELADLFLRMLTAAFTVTPVGQRPLEPPPPTALSSANSIDSSSPPSPPPSTAPSKSRASADDIVPILTTIVPHLRQVLLEQDRILTAATAITTSLIGPTFRSKAFPTNVTPALLSLLAQLTHLPGTQKAWKRDLSDAFLDSRFFLSPLSLVPGWSALSGHDRDRLPDLLSRITPPTAAGVLFGVGAASARLEADRRTGLNLKRLAFLLLSSPADTFVPHLPAISAKLAELLTATAISSPSSTGTRGEVYLLLRALALRTSAVHFAPLWPALNTELAAALSSLLPGADPAGTYSPPAVLAGAKLLDTLLVIAPDEFQLHEWLFITDTIEAVYPPPASTSNSTGASTVALVDVVAQELPGSARSAGVAGAGAEGEERGWGRRPWFAGRETAGGRAGGAEVVPELVVPFLRNLSIACYEGAYRMGPPDVGACERALVADLFDEAE
ncbi:Dopey, N-terminal-domain-containing protein [Geopyxis carbonaria]|nr:Dopey, N-terminal-domain-containing protein [Geopyxis carbonaria]